MSSPVMSPPPMAPPPRRPRSFAGPFVLIIIGFVFLLSTMHVLSVGRLAHLFASYWPVLLILWGIIKVVEHMQAQRQGARASGIGAGGVVLIVMIVVFGLIATQLERVNWSGMRDDFNFDDNDFSHLFNGNTYNFDDHLEQVFPAGASLKVIDTRGAVSVHASDDNKITVVVRKRIGAENQTDADKYNGETKPVITGIGGLVTVDAKADGAGDHAVETDLDISVPRKASVTVTSHRGDVSIAGRDGNVDVSAQRSDTSVEDVTGSVKISQDKGTVRVQQITGDVHVGNRLNEVSVSDVKGSLQLEGEFQESVKLERIAKTVTFKSSRTDMEFSRLDGSLELDSDELRADQVTGPLHLTTRSKNIRLDSVSGDVRLQDDNGSVEVAMRTVGNVQIDNRNGTVQLSLPDKAGFRLDARVRDGEIQSDFPELKVSNDDREARASGSVGNGLSHIVINNQHEGVEIRKGSAVATPAAAPVPPVPPKPGKALAAPKGTPQPTDN
ncbi:MAG: DUF4097 family beta strand repeat-containing protein [Candidatus Sulfotelmatobacter sp.]